MEKEVGQQYNDSKPLPQRNTFPFKQPRQPNIFFNSNFDSGNMHKVIRNSYDHYSIWTACDAQGTDNQGYPKSWFYFEVGGFVNRKVAFSVHRVHFLYAMSKRPEMYRPVCRIKYDTDEVSEWSRLPHQVLSLGMNNEEELVLKFDWLFYKNMKSVQFAFIYPYSHEQCRKDIESLAQRHQSDTDLYFGNWQMIKSYEKRVIDLVIISSHEGKQGYEKINCYPFQDKKIVKFRNNKPIIFISARVHPIQTPSSYCMKGIINFLLDKKDARAFLLRKYFVFVLVPMLNPDGVARGHCRMDALNQNLNRYYSSPDPEKQPSCYAVKRLCQHYNKDKRIFMYLDLHAHPAFKGNFTFGNAIYEFVQQVQSQLFSKVLSQNCISFEFEQCNFSRKHMKAKDRNQDISKQGCGRVVFYKQFGVVHSYTLECGYHMNGYDNQLQPQQSMDKKYVIHYKTNDKGEKIYEQFQRLLEPDKYQKYISQVPEDKPYQILQYTSHRLDDAQNQYYRRALPLFLEDTFQNLGRNILISILDIWNKNPYSRLSDLKEFRKQIAERQSKLDRFKKEQAGIKSKQRKIVQLIEEQFYGQWHKRNIFNPIPATVQPRDKKRNHTLGYQKMVALRPTQTQKSQKSEKVLDGKCMDHRVSEEVVSNDQAFSLRHQKDFVEEKVVTSEKVIEHRAYASRNFKVRGKLGTSQCQAPQRGTIVKGTSLNRELLTTQVKISLQDEIIKGSKYDGMTISSKIIKNGNLGVMGHVRVRNLLLSNGLSSLKKP